MEQIIIDGINLSDLKVKYDALAKEQAEMRSSIAKGSSKYIADAVKEALDHVANMKDAEELSTAEHFAEKATALLTTAKFVSDVSGVSYDLPYYDRQSEYYPDGDTITNTLEDNDYEVLTSKEANKSPALLALYRIAEDMEYEVAEWKTSYC